jgi:hypothetical protein
VGDADAGGSDEKERMSKPKVGIFGIWHPEDAGLAPLFEFEHLGSVATLQHLTAAHMQGLGDRLDLIILAMFGAPAWEVCAVAQPMFKRKAKVAVWTLDSHNAGWLDKEKAWAGKVDGFFSANNPATVQALGPTAHWLPCSVVWQSAVTTPPVDPNRTRAFDFGCVASYYQGNPRHDILMRVQRLLAKHPYRWFMGQASHQDVHELYSQSKVVVNCCMDTPPNVRAFEALLAGAVLLQHPAGLFSHARFADLREASLDLNPDLLDCATLNRALALAEQAPVRAEIIRKKHMLIHRYAELAEKLLR